MDIQNKLQFASIEEMKSNGEFFKRGSIIPRRILAIQSRRFQSCLKFGSDAWAFPTPKGYLVFVNSDIGENNYPAIKITKLILYIAEKNFNIDGSIYTPGGKTDFFGNLGCDNDAQWLDVINRDWILKHQFLNKEI